MHDSVLTWLKEQNLSFDKVLEVGSYNVNGSARTIIQAKEYIGVDAIAGPGVDLIMNGHDLDFEDETFDCVVSTEAIEHDDKFWLTMDEAGRVLKRGGILVLTTRGNGFVEHAFPADYWRFLPQSFGVLFKLASCVPHKIESDPSSPGLFGIGVKR